MGRWEPGASGRLRAAAIELYVERGFQQTTVADIAERAGVTPRTFFRHFADKREVLFDQSIALEGALVEALLAAPDAASPLEAVGAALDAAADLLGDRREYSRQRQRVIKANKELLERELMKMASLSAALTEGLRQRGVPDLDARLAAESGIAVLRVAFERWVTEPGDRSLKQLMRDSLSRLTSLTAEGA